MKEGLVSRFADLITRLPKGDADFLRDMLTGIVYTVCNGIRLGLREKERQEWKIPTHDFVRFNRMLLDMNEDDRRTAAMLVADSEKYAIKIAEEGLSRDVQTFLLDTMSDAKRIFWLDPSF